MGLVKIAVTPGFEVGGSLFTSEQLAQIGLYAGENAKIELTTFKQLYVEMQEERIAEFTRKLKEVGLEIYPAGFVTKSLITCNFCRGAEDAGLEIAERLNQAIAGIETPSPLKIGYAGCALGTSEPLLKDIGVVKMKDNFDVYIGGEPKSIKPSFAMMFASGVPADKLIPVVLGLIDYFKNHGKKKEKFSKFTQRIAMETLREASNL
ncbi:nitrite reductase [Paenibacillus sp. GP183]|uniref:nitrite reductase n=1 Tax=Paenibacillus sp. GP183 TaxID=1882751 RepID=UPI0008970BD6|nr:nitrite reductase [Paenibacillus sp. GP183]SEB51424.1 Nitrite and sulphite reductase 4Fe-4S domain-containing protein [Paenibacillus sp. GP183]